MRRKIWRDLSGQVGWKRAKAVLKRDLTGGFRGKTAAGTTPGWHNLRGVFVTNAILLGILAALGHPELYLLWVVAWFTVNSLVTRIRSIAEHAMAPDPSDELRNTRTTLARRWERIFVAPNRVNFHLEHHLLMTVPLYNLPRLHRMRRPRRRVGEPGLLADPRRGRLEAVLSVPERRDVRVAARLHSGARRPPR